MTDYNTSYAKFNQYYNSDISKLWNNSQNLQPIRAPVISSIKTNVFQPFPKSGFQTLKSAYPYFPGVCNNVTRPTCQ